MVVEEVITWVMTLNFVRSRNEEDRESEKARRGKDEEKWKEIKKRV